MRAIFSTEPLTITSTLPVDPESRRAVKSDDRRARRGPASAEAASGSCHTSAAATSAATCQITRQPRSERSEYAIGCEFCDIRVSSEGSETFG